MPDDFPEQLAELLAYFEGTIPISSPLARLAKVLPGRPETPEPWLLGSSPQSAVWAGELGLPYAFADFINPERRRDRGALPARLRRRRAARRAADRRRRLGARRRHRGGGDAAGDQQPDGVHDAAPRAPDRRPAARRSPSASSPPSGDGLSQRRRTIVGTPAQVRAGIEQAASRVRRGRGDRRHDHLRPRRPPPLLRADRGRARPDRCRRSEPCRGRPLTQRTPEHWAALPYARLPPPSRTPATASMPQAPLRSATLSPIHVPAAATSIPSVSERWTTFALTTFPAPPVTPMPQPGAASRSRRRSGRRGCPRPCCELPATRIAVARAADAVEREQVAVGGVDDQPGLGALDVVAGARCCRSRPRRPRRRCRRCRRSGCARRGSARRRTAARR